MEKTDLSLPEFVSKAARYCAAAEHCETEVREKLYQWSCPGAWVDQVIDGLYEQNYLNDVRYCAAFVHDKVAYQAWGRQKIRAALQARRLPGRLIDEALKNIDFIEYNRQLKRLVEKKKGTEPDRLVRFLLQRGFTYDEITSSLS